MNNTARDRRNILRDVRELEALGLLDAGTLQAVEEIKELAADVDKSFARKLVAPDRRRVLSFWQGCLWNSQS